MLPNVLQSDLMEMKVEYVDKSFMYLCSDNLYAVINCYMYMVVLIINLVEGYSCWICIF